MTEININSVYTIFNIYLIRFSNLNEGNCTAVTDLTSGLWSIQSCSKNNNFACQRSPGQCPDGWRIYKNKCYLFNEQRELHTSWFDANLTCLNYRARLLNIKE